MSAFKVVSEHISWLEHTYEKLGNQIQMEPIGYSKSDNKKGILELKVTNSGLSDQLSPIEIKFPNYQFKTAEKDNTFKIKGLKRRSNQTVQIPVTF